MSFASAGDRTPVVQSVVRHYTDRANSVPRCTQNKLKKNLAEVYVRAVDFAVSICSSSLYYRNTAVVNKRAQLSNMWSCHAISKTTAKSNKLNLNAIWASFRLVHGSKLTEWCSVKEVIFGNYRHMSFSFPRIQMWVSSLRYFLQPPSIASLIGFH
jgi:hypothetical protein